MSDIKKQVMKNKEIGNFIDSQSQTMPTHYIRTKEDWEVYMKWLTNVLRQTILKAIDLTEQLARADEREKYEKEFRERITGAKAEQYNFDISHIEALKQQERQKIIDIIEKEIEPLSELEHKQWIYWSKSIANRGEISAETLKRWQKCWIPYSELTEEQKEYDRIWARKVLKTLLQKIKEAK